MVRLRSPRLGSLSSHVLVGAALSLMTHCGATRMVLFLGEGKTPVSCGEADVTPPRVDLSGVVGVGVRVDGAESFAMTVDLLLSRGLRDVRQFDEESRNRTFGLIAGVEWLVNSEEFAAHWCRTYAPILDVSQPLTVVAVGSRSSFEGAGRPASRCVLRARFLDERSRRRGAALARGAIPPRAAGPARVSG